MIENTSKNWNSMTDAAIIADIGSFIKNERLKQGKTQALVAEFAGINRYTIKQIETGKAISLSSLISILRALDLFYVLDSFEVKPQVSPMLQAKLAMKTRKRARSKKYKLIVPKDNIVNDLGW